jgi:fused signal recognition particle receptor
MADEERPGWWGSTLGKLKEKLARTKNAIVDSIADRAPDEQEPQQQQPEAQPEPTVELQPEPQPQPEQIPVAAGTQSTAPPQVIAPPSASQAPVLPAPQSAIAVPVQAAPPKPSFPAPKPVAPARAIDDDYLEDLEEKLIKADLGLATAQTLVDHLRKESRAQSWTSRDVEAFLKREFSSILAAAPNPKLTCDTGKLNVYVVVGVNGTGKTTSIGKLCWRFKQDGKKVLMAAADTFRAAAETQLEIWSEKAGVDIVRLPDGSDPGAVVYQAIQKAKADVYDCLVIDTAGRLHNKVNLMAELKKVRSVIEKNATGSSLESLLVLDASTGQNGLQQAKVFTEVCPLTGVILTKLDGTAKGGVVFSIARDLSIPVKLIGLGEKIDDLRDFEPEMFVEALFS